MAGTNTKGEYKPTKRMLWKDIFRTLRKSKGRFFSIAALIALGSFALVGFQITGSNMRTTLANYTTSYGFTDLTVIGDLGIDEDDMADIESVAGIRAVEYGYLVDVTIEGTDDSVRIQNVPEELSCYELVEGELPTSDDEIAIGQDMADDYGLEIGDTVTFYEAEDELTGYVLTNHTFTVVGIVNSTEILSYLSKGSTTVGTGDLTYYAVTDSSAFDVDYYMCARISFEDTDGLDPTTDEYLELVAVHKAELEEALAEAGERRYATVAAEYQDAIDEGEAELADGEQELADAETELADAADELADAETELADAETELADAETELADAAAELADAKSELAAAAAEIADAADQIEAAQAELASAKAQVAAAEEELAANKETLDAAAATLAASESELETAAAQIAAAEAEIAEGEAALETAADELAAYEAQLAALQASGATDDETLAAIAQLEAVVAAYEAQISSGTSELETAKTELAAAQAAYEEGLAAYEEGLAEYEAGLAEYEAAAAQVAAAEVEITQSEAELEAAEAELAAAKSEYAAGLAEYEEGVAAYEEGLAEYEEGVAEYEDGLAEYEDGLAEYEEALAEYEEEAPDAYAEIDEGYEDLELVYEALAELTVPDYTVQTHRETYGSDGYTVYIDVSEIVDSLARIFPYFLYLVAALVASTTMTRMVDEERVNTGTLKALGYGDMDVLKKFVAYGAAAGLIGAVVGIVLGHTVLPLIVYMAMGDGFSLPQIELSFHPVVTLVTVALSLLVSVGPAIVAAKAEVTEKPAALLTPKAPASGSKIFLERITPLWNRLSFTHKVTCRNLFRYKARAAMTIIGVAGAACLMFCGFAVQNSVNGISEKQFGDIIQYDLIVANAENASDDEVAEVESMLESDDVTDYAEIYYEELTCVAGDAGDTQTINLLVAIDEEEVMEYLNLYDGTTWAELELPEEGAIISKRLAQLAGVEVGDYLTFTDADGNEETVLVAGICKMYMEHFMFMSASAYESNSGDVAENNAYVVALADDSVEATRETAARFMELEGVLGTVQSATLINLVDVIVDALNQIMVILIVVSIMLACVIVYNLVTINVAERMRELSTIKVLGFHSTETTMYIYRETIVLSVIALPVGWFLGYLLQQYIINAVCPDNVMFSGDVGTLAFIVSTVVIVAVVALMGLVVYRKLKTVDMLEALKSVD